MISFFSFQAHTFKILVKLSVYAGDGTYCYCDLAQDVLRYGSTLIDNSLIELIQRSVHQLHADPNITLTTQKKKQNDKNHRQGADAVVIECEHWLHLSEEGTIEGHSEETVHCPHRNVQIHQKPFLLLCVDCGTNPL